MSRILFWLSMFLTIFVLAILILSWQAGQVKPKRKEIRHEITHYLQD